MIRRFPPVLRSLWAVWFIIGVICPAAAQAPRAKQHLHETLLLDVDTAATKKFATVQTHLRVGQLPEAVELLRSISDAHQGKLVATTPGRYVNVQNYVQMLAAGLPPEGLRIYRQQLDPVLKPSFDRAREAADETLLLKILQQGYCCSFADDALMLLGDLAWDAGDVWKARSFWKQLLPPPRPKALGEPVIWLAYPDSDLDLGMIVARLILCTIQSGDQQEIQREIAGFAERYPDITGHLAGREGKLLTILKDVADDAAKWPVAIQTSAVETFAGSPQRQHLETQSTGLGTLRWRASLRPFGEEQRRGFQQAAIGGLCYFPVVYGDVVLVNDDEHIHAYRLQTGQPAWSDDPTDARIYMSGFSTQDGAALPRGMGDGPVGNIGLPRFTMTIADGRLYARMGSVQAYSNQRSGLLVCLDLAHGEGKLVWETFASTIEQETGGWNFEGSPLVMGGRVYVGLRRLNPQPQSNVACFDALTGKLIWNRKLCVGQTNPNFSEFDVNQHLLTWGEGTLFYTTHMGAVAALDPRSGTIKWIVSYPRVDDTKLRHEYAARLQRGPLPAMFADGMLYAAPIDSDELIAFDAETGMVKWRRSFHSPIQSLLGVTQGMVFVSGSQLWGVANDTGKVLWTLGDPDPESHGFGRGLLVEDVIYWPTHEEIFVIEQSTGTIQQRLPLFAVHGQSGGNLLLTEHHLLVAQPDSLAVFSDHGPAPRRSKTPRLDVSRRTAPAAKAWELARAAVESQDWQQAADQYRAVGELASSDDEWMGQSLAGAARDGERDARLRQAWQFTKTDPTMVPQILKMAFERSAIRNRAPLDRLVRDAPAEADSLEPADFQAADRRGGQLYTPRSVPTDMANWLSVQLEASIKDSPPTNPALGLIPLLEWVTEYHDVFRRVLTVSASPVADVAAAGQALSAAEQLVSQQPEQALSRLRELLLLKGTHEQQARIWCCLAQCLETLRAWEPAERAWQQARLNSTSNQVVSVQDQQIPLEELISERLEQPQYSAQKAVTENDAFAWPLHRSWEQAYGPTSQTVYPVGIPPSIAAACVLVNRPQLTCLNLADGTPRWQLQLSHPVQWAGFSAEKLILGTAVEVRAVAVADGETIWWQRVGWGDGNVERTPHQLISAQANSQHSNVPSWRVRTSDLLQAAAGHLQDFSLSDDRLLARQGAGDIVAWDINQGHLAWHFTATRGLAAGWGVTSQHVYIGQLMPDTLVVLNRANGTEVARFPSTSANWIRPPLIRDDGSMVTVGPWGRIESWAKPGDAWDSDEGPRAWILEDTISPSNQLTELRSDGRLSLLSLNSKILVAVDSLRGNILWKAFQGLTDVEDARGAIQSADGRIYVAAGGILRAFGKEDGRLLWERYLGGAAISWQVKISGTAVMGYPSQSGAADSDAKITICDAQTGAYLQRINLPPNQPNVQVYPTPHTTLVACGGKLTGLRR